MQNVTEKQNNVKQAEVIKKGSRQNYCIGIIGTNRTGKSSIARNMIAEYKKQNPGNDVIVHDYQNRFSDLATDYIFIHQKHWLKRLPALRNCLLVLDDYRVIYEKDTRTPELTLLLHMRSAWNVDIIYICHSPSMVINLLTIYTTHYMIFATNADEGTFKKKIPNYKVASNACYLINKYLSAFGRGNYPNFPFIIVDNEKGEMIAQNLDLRKFKKLN